MKQKAETAGFTKWMLSSAAVGALATYLTDPGHGRRRRALARDKIFKIRSGVAKSRNQVDVALRDLRNRTQGLGVQAKSLLGSSGKQDDDHVVTARVREKLGPYRAARQPHRHKKGSRRFVVRLSGRAGKHA
jgi:hypothetical protein